MDFRFSEQEDAFRDEVLAFIREVLPAGWVGFPEGEEYTYEALPFTMEVARRLGGRGWLTLAWPTEYGGRGASYMQQLIYKEEVAYHRVPGTEMGLGGVA